MLEKSIDKEIKFSSTSSENSDTSEKNLQEKLEKDKTMNIIELHYNNNVFCTQYLRKYTNGLIMFILVYALFFFFLQSNSTLILSLHLGIPVVCALCAYNIVKEQSKISKQQLYIKNNTLHMIEYVKKNNEEITRHTQCKTLYSILDKPFTIKLFGEFETLEENKNNSELDQVKFISTTSIEIPKAFNSLDELNSLILED